MSGYVLDSSVAIAWCFEDEHTPEIVAALDAAPTASICVPSLFPLELTNIWLMSLRRGRLKEAQLPRVQAIFNRLDIEVDAQTAERAWDEVLNLARAERLTTYDASYLELALRRDLPLATRDAALAAAARRRRVGLLLDEL